MDYLSTLHTYRHKIVSTSGFCKSLQLGDFSCWNSNAIKNTSSLENNSIFEKQKMAVTAFREQSKARPSIRNRVTSPSHKGSKLKRCLAIKKPLCIYMASLIQRSPHTKGQAPARCSRSIGLHPPPNPTELARAVCREPGSSCRHKCCNLVFVPHS